jgi:hypothetical protein
MKKIWSRDSTELVILFLFTYAAVYIIPIFSYFLFVVIFILIYQTKKDYFWIAFLFILMQFPGHLFSSGNREETQQLPLYSLGVGISFTVFEIAMFIMLIKAFISKRILFNWFKKDFQILLVVILFYLIISLMFGITGRSLILTLRGLLSWSWVFLIPMLLKNSEDVRKLCQLLFPIVILALLSLIYSYMTGQYLDEVIRNEEATNVNRQIEEGSQFASRAESSVFLILICYMMSFYYLLNIKSEFPKIYINLILFTCYFAILLTATRGWIIAFSFIGLLVFITQSAKLTFFKVIGFVLMALLSFQVLILVFPVVSTQFSLSLGRLNTMELFLEGDVTAGGTLSRLDERGPRVLKKFVESPISGFGFSDDFRNNFDEHVGHHSMLLSYGILGYLLIMGYFLKWIRFTYNAATKLNKLGSVNASTYKIFSFFLIGAFIIHSSSTQFIGFYFLHPVKYMVYGIFFGIFLTLYNDELFKSNHKLENETTLPK